MSKQSKGKKPQSKKVAALLQQLQRKTGHELFPKAVDGRARSSGDSSFPVDEHDAVDQVL
jgi:hypothetical protein